MGESSMSALGITVSLILITLASAVVSVLWEGKSWRKRLLLVLAVCSSAGAIYQAHEMERRAAAVSGALEALVLDLDSVPFGFEDALLETANRISIEERYSRAILWTTDARWGSEHFGYGILFLTPSDGRPRTGYEELAMLTGHAHAFLYVPMSTVRDLALAFVRGSDLKQMLEDRVMWVWETADVTDERFVESVRGLAYLAYSAATNRQYTRDFQAHPERFWVELLIDEGEDITVLAVGRDHRVASAGGVVLGYVSWSVVEEWVGQDAITRGGMAFYNLFDQILTDWADPEYLPVVLRR